MPARNVDRIWLVAGGIGAAIMLAIGWFLLIGPQRSETASLEDEVGNKEVEITKLESQLRTLKEDDSKKDQYAAELAKNRGALPTAAGTADFVRQLQAGGDEAGVRVSNVGVGEATEVTGLTPMVYSVAIALTAEGTAVQLDRFLDQLQLEQPRAVLIRSTSVSAAAGSGKSTGLSLAVNLEVFVAPPGGGAADPSASPAAAASK